MSHRVIETVSTVTTLGIRFWDPVTDAQIRDGLVVTACAATQSRSTPFVNAARTLSGYYAFHKLPGLVRFENGSIPIDGSPLAARRFRIETRDTLRRFLDTAFEVDVPLGYRGLFPAAAGSPGGNAPGFLLYSAPTRRRPSWLGCVRGELEQLGNGRPAAHAVVAVRDPGGRTWRGIADEAGRFIVFLAFPEIEASLGGSPPSPGQAALGERSWVLRVAVFHQASMLRALPGTTVPDLQSILNQSPETDVWQLLPSEGGTPQSDWVGELHFGGELVARTGDGSKLLVGPETTSP
jgi:hypothetical protein